MEILNKEKFYIVIFSSIILFYLFLFSNYFNSYYLIAFTDHDEGYLLEQLLLKIYHLNIERFVSIEIEYGVEFYYFSYFFNFFLNLINLNKLNIYFIIISIHAIFSLLAFYFLFKIFNFFNLNNIYFILFITSLLSIPEVFYHASSMKPDLNILFFLLISTIYFFKKFMFYGGKKNFYLTIFLLALSFSIKIWSIPFLIIFFSEIRYYRRY